jgi:hypothetical protein
MRAFRFSIAAAILVCAIVAAAQTVRDFPPDAKRARFSVVQFPTVQIGRDTLSLAPGAQIRDTTNQIIMATSLSGRYRVLYTLDSYGQVYRVWLVTDEEWAWARSQGM